MATKVVNKIAVHMYRPGGTGDCFLLQFKKGTQVSFNLMIDCGCINGSADNFAPILDDIAVKTKQKIDLLVLTHEHADHINGFTKAADKFVALNLKVAKVWFAWTESKTDADANDYRQNHTLQKLALSQATQKLNKLQGDQYFQQLLALENEGEELNNGIDHYIAALNGLNDLNLAATGTETMEDILRRLKIIDASTIVEYQEPGKTLEDLLGAEGIRFFILGPPRDLGLLSKEESKSQGYEKREVKSNRNQALVEALALQKGKEQDLQPFESTYFAKGKASTQLSEIRKKYRDEKHLWRKIDHDWLFGGAELALKLEQSINNTSLVMAIQFVNSEKILLFPGDAEYGNWLSWGAPGLSWSFVKKNERQTVKVDYLLKNTVLYKVGHHLSQNGTGKEIGLEQMTHPDLAAMATLDFGKILTGWLNTMPNDLLSAELIRKTRGKFFFSGACEDILSNIQTERVTIEANLLKEVRKNNKKFDKKIAVEYTVSG